MHNSTRQSLTVFGWAHIELNHWPFSSNFTVRIGLSDPSVPPKWSIRNGSTTWNSLNWSIYKTITISFVFLCRLTNFLLDNRRKQVHDYILMWDVDNNPSILFWRGFAWFYGWVGWWGEKVELRRAEKPSKETDFNLPALFEPFSSWQHKCMIHIYHLPC